MRLFLDIDGLFLTIRGELAEGTELFLKWAIEHHQPYWISSRTRDGSHTGAVNAFYNCLEPSLIQSIPTAKWNTLKTEALPLRSHDWVWIDDELLATEREVLKDSDNLDRFVRVNIDRNSNAVLELPEQLNLIRY